MVEPMLNISKLELVKPMGRTNKTLGFYPKRLPELGGYCTHNTYDPNVGGKLWVM